MMRRFVLCSLLALGVCACNNEKAKEEAPQVQPETKPKVAEKPKAKKKRSKITLSPDAPKTKLDIPTVAELEEEASRRIKPENLESELDRLEAEIVGIPD